MSFDRAFENDEELYGSFSMKFPPQITDTQTKELARRWRKGGGALNLNRIVEGHLRLVQSIAGQYKCDKDDVFQEGCKGMMRAAELFDPEKGVKFSTYATQRIRRSIQWSLEKEKKQVPKVALEVETEDGYMEVNIEADEPTVHEVAEQRQAAQDLKVKLSGLEYEPRRVLELRFGLYEPPQTRKQVAATFRTSESRIRRIEAQGLETLRSIGR